MVSVVATLTLLPSNKNEPLKAEENEKDDAKNDRIAHHNPSLGKLR